MQLHVEKGIFWPEDFLVSGLLCKSLSIAVCLDFIASVIRQQYLRVALPVFLPPYHNNHNTLSLDEATYRFIQLFIAINFSDLRFDVAFVIGLGCVCKSS